MKSKYLSTKGARACLQAAPACRGRFRSEAIQAIVDARREATLWRLDMPFDFLVPGCTHADGPLGDTKAPYATSASVLAQARHAPNTFRGKGRFNTRRQVVRYMLQRSNLTVFL